MSHPRGVEALIYLTLLLLLAVALAGRPWALVGLAGLWFAGSGRA